MNFLAPLFLLGGLAIALPVVFHLIRRTTRERTRFSSLMFLQPSPPRLTRRNRLEHLLLLLLRAAVLGLLALGFARPFLKGLLPATPAADPVRRQVVLLDTSASMQREELWPAAVQKVEALVRQARPGDQLALVAFDRAIRPLVTFEAWAALPAGDRLAHVRSVLADIRPGWSATAPDTALLAAADLLTEATPAADATATRQVILVSDLQEGSRLTALQGREWPDPVAVVVERVSASASANAGLHWLPETPDSARGAEPGIRLRVSNAADSRREQFQVGWANPAGDGFVEKPQDVYVPPGQSRLVNLAVPAGPASPGRALLRGDDAPFDNAVALVPPTQLRLTVRYFGSEAADDARQPLYFLRRAFPDTRRRKVDVVKAADPGPGVMAADNRAPLLVVSEALTDANAVELKQALEEGHLVLFAPKSAEAGATLAKLPGLAGIRVSEADRTSYALLGEIDFRHPLFAPFADPRFSDFTKIHFWKHRRFDLAAVPAARVVARFDNEDPAIVEVPSGKGRVVVLASGWQPDESQLALSSKFVPLLHALLDLAGNAAPPPAQYLVGDPIPLPATVAGDFLLRRPDGSATTLPAGATAFGGALAPGVYTLAASGWTQQFAVNLDPAESRTAPLPVDELERLGLPGPRPTLAPAQMAAVKTRQLNTELESRQKLWRWFILAALALLLAETWLAGRTARRASTPAEVPA